MGFSKQLAVDNANKAVTSVANALRSQLSRGISDGIRGSSTSQGRSTSQTPRTSGTSLYARSNAYNPGSSQTSDRSSGQRANNSATSIYARSNAYNPESSRLAGTASGTQAGRSSNNRSRLTAAGEGYDVAQKDDAKQQAEEQQQLEESGAGDDFQADFDAYSAEHLNGMGINDFMRVDPNSQEDRNAWRAMVEDETMSAYYDDLINEYGGFDQYWDAMTANTLADVLADDQLQLQYFGSGDVTQSIMDQLAYEGYYPAITGDTGQQAEISSMLASDPQAAADLMAYNYRQNLGGMLAQEVENGNMTLDDARGILSLDEYNELGDYGNMQYGYGNGYDMGASAFDPESFEVNGAISPADWNRSIENRYTSLPGYGLASVGDDRAIARYLYDAGYQEQEGVPELWASYYGEDTSEEE